MRRLVEADYSSSESVRAGAFSRTLTIVEFLLGQKTAAGQNWKNESNGKLGLADLIVERS